MSFFFCFWCETYISFFSFRLFLTLLRRSPAKWQRSSSSRIQKIPANFTSRVDYSEISKDILLIHPSRKTQVFPRAALPERRWRMTVDSSTCNAFFTGISRHNRRLPGRSFVETIAWCVVEAPLHQHHQFGRICFGTWGVVSRHETNVPTTAANNEELPSWYNERGKPSLMSTTENNALLIGTRLYIA